MTFIADFRRQRKLWEYISGDANNNKSIMVDRYMYLIKMAGESNDFKLAFHDHETGTWTKWGKFPGLLKSVQELEPVIDVHRSVLPNEIVVESDYPTYEENLEATKIIGAIIEKKGFIPLYYYSGSKSIHIHIFVDFEGFQIDDKKQFIEWLRALMITCWGTNARKFDAELIRANHLIRAELSKNKLGFKTFMGHKQAELPQKPPIFNENNGLYPRLCKERPSIPLKSIAGLKEEYVAWLEDRARKDALNRKNRSLNGWIKGSDSRETIRNCIKIILSDDFKAAGDGFQRGMFILVNELKRILGEEQAEIVVNDWNERMGRPVRDNDIRVRLKNKDYTLTCEFVHGFLEDLGIKPPMNNCRFKI